MGHLKKSVKANSFVSVVYQNGKAPKDLSAIRDWIRTTAELTCPDKHISVSLNPKADTAYIQRAGKKRENFRIVLSSMLTRITTGMPDEFDNKDKMRPFVLETRLSLCAQFIHELGHAKFTDMVSDTIAAYPKKEYIGFLHNLFNVMEDPKQEDCMSSWWKINFPYKLQASSVLRWQVKKIFGPAAEKYEDDGTPGGFLNYLLLCLRVGRKNIKRSCAVFEKYQEGIVPRVKAFLVENDGTKRVQLAVELGEWLIENVTEFDWGEVRMPPKSEIKSGSMPTGSKPEKGVSSGKDILEDGSASSSPETDKPTPDSGDSKGKEGESASDAEGKAGEKEGEEEGEKEAPEEEGEEVFEDDIEDREVTDEIIDDFIQEGEDHEWIVAKDEYEYDPLVVEKLDEQIEEFTDAINDVSKFLTLFKGRIKPRETSGFSRGKFDVKAAIRNRMSGGCDVKCFKQKTARGKDADLAVSLLCDNSGSMSGKKSRICSKAALVLGQACEWADIPFECNAFTKERDGYDYTSFTIVEKGFEDSFQKAKPYFAINDSELLDRYLQSERRIFTFSGNSEEVNLHYVWKKFASVKHKTKLLIVLCDGETTGSEDELKKVVNNIEAEDGIIVIGIGICCRAVAEIYPHHKLFNTEQELSEELAPYLIDVVSKYSK